MMELVRSRDAGNPAYGETCTQYLFLDETEYDKPDFEGAKYVFTPPLVSRERRTVRASRNSFLISHSVIWIGWINMFDNSAHTIV